MNTDIVLCLFLGVLLALALWLRRGVWRSLLAAACFLLQLVSSFDVGGVAGRAVFSQASQEGRDMATVLWTLDALDNYISGTRFLVLGLSFVLVVLVFKPFPTTSEDSVSGDPVESEPGKV